MNNSWKWALLVLVIGCTIGALTVGMGQNLPAQGADKGGECPGCQRYQVVHTEGSNLIAADNKTNILYFYSIDKDKEVGDELVLRGTIDLNLLGKASIRPVTIKKKDR